MTFKETMDELREMGTAQNRKIYKRHGAGDNQFGVSFANLNKLKKRIKSNHELAVKLWDSGNIDAMTLATMIGDGSQMDEKTIDKWMSQLSYYMLIDLFKSAFVFKSPHAMTKMKEWIKSDDEWLGRAGWGLLGSFARQENELTDEFFEEYLNQIETNIHKAKNRTREAMNQTLISIGTRNRRLEKTAVSAAKRIGEVIVDHGDTSCKTPEAVSYIRKTWDHKERKKKKKAS